MSKRLIEKLAGEANHVSDFETEEEMLAHKVMRQEASPNSIFEEIDTTEATNAKKAKEAKKLSFSFKGLTVEELRAELNEYLELSKS